jgi:hypothetical protein
VAALIVALCNDSNLTVRTFPAGKARNRAIAILGLVGSVSFSLGVVIGEFLQNPGDGAITSTKPTSRPFRWTVRGRILEVAVPNSVDHFSNGDRYGCPRCAPGPNNTWPQDPRNPPQDGSLWTALLSRFDSPACAGLDVWTGEWMGGS